MRDELELWICQQCKMPMFNNFTILTAHLDRVHPNTDWKLKTTPDLFDDTGIFISDIKKEFHIKEKLNSFEVRART